MDLDRHSDRVRVLTSGATRTLKDEEKTSDVDGPWDPKKVKFWWLKQRLHI